jgi:transcription elongation factor GreA
MKQIRFTKEGFEKAQQEYEELQKQRPAVVEDLKKAREMGDLKENGYYQASRRKLSYIDGRLFRLKMDMKYAVIIKITAGNKVSIGSQVTLANEERESTYKIVGDFEANPSEGKISLLSPLGRAIDGKKMGDEVALETPRGRMVYKLVAIK